jgi:hypothetical protein
MTPIELLADLISRDYGLLEMTLADFSDADLFVRPVPGANHAMWQLGHLATSTAFFAAAIPGGKSPEIPADWKDKFGKGASTADDPKAFPSRAEVMKALAASKDAVLAATKNLKWEDLEKSGPDQLKSFAPTIGHLVHVIGSHWTMHVGQFQVIRRKLGKPVLF